MNAHAGNGPKAKPCPICQAPSIAAEAPFCSRRCRNLDLHRWFTGGYSIPTNEAPYTEEGRDDPDPDR
jgi:uncharacterized protein